MKTNKHLTLLFIQKKETVRARDIVNKFDYSPGTARSYLSYLSRQGLLERTGTGYAVTEKGQGRLSYFEIRGCGNFDCPLCQKKKPGHIACPGCGHNIPIKEARIKPERDFIIWKTEAGVYCPDCNEMVLTDKKALSMGIRKKGRA